MNLENNKGITLIVLMITIIVMLIIAGITIYSGSVAIKEAKVEDVKTNMLLLQAEMKQYAEQAKFENKNTIEGEDGITVDDVVLKVEEPRDIEGKTFYKISTPMSELKLGSLDSNNYLVSFNIDEIDVDVYFVPGITDSEGTTYHKLSDMQE